MRRVAVGILGLDRLVRRVPVGVSSPLALLLRLGGGLDDMGRVLVVDVPGGGRQRVLQNFFLLIRGNQCATMVKTAYHIVGGDRCEGASGEQQKGTVMPLKQMVVQKTVQLKIEK